MSGVAEAVSAISSVATPHEPAHGLAQLGITAFTTTRAAGSFALAGYEPAGAVLQRWTALLHEVGAAGIVSSPQPHGDTVLRHSGGWRGILRTNPADGHACIERGVALAVSVADCVPVFLAHPSGAVAVLHSGWRGTVARIVDRGVRTLARVGLSPDELRAHLGPAICGRCYEVSAEVREQLTGEPATRGGQVDLRAIIAEQLREAGVRQVTMSPSCTRCDNGAFFSHRAGDVGRQVAVIVACS